MMSTADSQLLVATSAVAEDIYRNFVNKNAEEKKLVTVSRIVTFFVGVAAFILAITTEDLVFTMVSFAWCGLGAAFGPALLLTLWWKKTTKEGVLSGLVIGTGVTLIWHFNSSLNGIIAERAPAFVLSLISVWLVSLMTHNKKRA